MRRIILLAVFSCIAFATSVIGQCEFPMYDRYGLICDEARFLCGYEMDGYTGRLLDQKSPQPQPDPLCEGAGEADNIQWFSFVADDTDVEIVIRYSNCTGNVLSPGLQVGIFEHCELADDMSPMGSIYCIEDINYTDIVLTPNPADIEVGQLYLLFIDGYAGSACDFEIDVIKGVCTDAPDAAQECVQDCGVVSAFSGYEGCTLFQDNFMFTPSSQIIPDLLGCNPDVQNTRLDSIICVEWEIQPDMGFNFISSSFSFYDSLEIVSTLTVEWTLPGVYTIKPKLSINPLFSTCQEMCECTDDVVYTITISESTLIQLPDVELCPGECVDFCGNTFCDPGIQECYDRDNCEISVLSIVDKTLVEINQGLIVLCSGDCYDFQGQQYCLEDSYTIVDSTACDTMHLFEIEELDLEVNLIQSDSMLNCNVSEAVLEGAYNTNFTGSIHTAWISDTGDTLAQVPLYSTTEEGDYTFVAWADDRKECSVSLTHTVLKDVDVPSAVLMSPSLDCNTPQGNITVNTPDSIISVQWTGPNGFSSNDLDPEVDTEGIYEVTLIAENGCELVLFTEVFEDFSEPVVVVDYNNFTCSEEIPVSSFTTSSSLASHEWTLPDGSFSSDDVLALNGIGNYVLTVTGTNGCTNTTPFQVVDQSYDPSLFLNEDRIWRCNDTEVILDFDAQSNPNLQYIWTTLEGAEIANTINVTFTEPGTYILTSIDNAVDCIGSDTVRIMEDPNPFVDVELTSLSPRCEDGVDGTVELDSIFGGEGPYEFELGGKLYTNTSDILLASGQYVLTVVDVFGCRVSKNIEIPKAPEFNVTIIDELAIRFGERKTLTFESSIDESEISLIEWSDEEGNILGLGEELVFVGEPIEFIYLRLENLEGCEVMTEIRVNLSYDVDIYYPNVFSPNDDGRNDIFTLYNNGYPEMADDLKIFDRSGELIYTSSQTEFNDSQVGWDGTFNGDKCQPGVYVFMLEYTLMNGESRTLSGTITLVR